MSEANVVQYFLDCKEVLEQMGLTIDLRDCIIIKSHITGLNDNSCIFRTFDNVGELKSYIGGLKDSFKLNRHQIEVENILKMY